MACGCKKEAQQAAGARVARTRRVARNAASVEDKVGWHPRQYYVLPMGESLDGEDGDVDAEKYPTLAEAHKRLRDLGPGWKVETRRG